MYKRQLSDLNLSIETLAKLHKCSKDFSPIDGSEKRIGLEDYYLSVNKHFNELLENANLAFSYKDKFSKIYLKNFDNNLAPVSYTHLDVYKRQN